MSAKTCCVTGHKDIPAGKLDGVKAGLQTEILQAIGDGYTNFISGFAEGVDLLFAAIVADLIKSNPALTLEAALPYRTRLNSADGLFRRLLSACKTVGVYNERYSPACDMRRNREMVSLSQRVIAVYDGREKGGTLFTMRYAYTQGREVRVIRI